MKYNSLESLFFKLKVRADRVKSRHGSGKGGGRKKTEIHGRSREVVTHRLRNLTPGVVRDYFEMLIQQIYMEP